MLDGPRTWERLQSTPTRRLEASAGVPVVILAVRQGSGCVRVNKQNTLYPVFCKTFVENIVNLNKQPGW
ncbi:hypothetical protein J6590_040395 [Homalodisca vitripennis]|nr:hypothetical protein J6590_040395 [Homalodisca vitripennis]